MVGNLPFEAAVRIANMKLKGMLAYELKTTVKEVIGTCVSMGVNVDGERRKKCSLPSPKASMTVFS